MSRSQVFFVLALAFMQTVLAQPNRPRIEEKLICGNGSMPPFFDERCCGNEPYTLGHVSALLKFYKDCAVEPEDKTVTIAQSQWAFYNCLVEKSLGSNEITPETYVNMMAGSLPDSKKAEILDALEKDSGAAGSDDTPKSRQLWSKYFSAESRVCNGDDGGKSGRPAPTIPFESGDVPAIMFLPVTVREIYLREQQMEDKYDFKNPMLSQALYPVALLTLAGVASESDLAVASDYEAMLDMMMPKYISQNSKDKLMKAMMDCIKTEFPSLGESPSSSEITAAIAEQHKAELDSLKDADKTLVMNGLVGIHIIMAVGKSMEGPKVKDF